jgi:hypothetical protein
VEHSNGDGGRVKIACLLLSIRHPRAVAPSLWLIVVGVRFSFDRYKNSSISPSFVPWKHSQQTFLTHSVISYAMDLLPHSVEVEAEKWKGNPEYLFKSIAPRISKTAVAADDASIQAQIDVFGLSDVGMITGSLASAGNFAAVTFAESKPDRLPIVAYLTEMLSFYDGS